MVAAYHSSALALARLAGWLPAACLAGGAALLVVPPSTSCARAHKMASFLLKAQRAVLIKVCLTLATARRGQLVYCAVYTLQAMPMRQLGATAEQSATIADQITERLVRSSATGVLRFPEPMRVILKLPQCTGSLACWRKTPRCWWLIAPGHRCIWSADVWP